MIISSGFRASNYLAFVSICSCFSYQRKASTINTHDKLYTTQTQERFKNNGLFFKITINTLEMGELFSGKFVYVNRQ